MKTNIAILVGVGAAAVAAGLPLAMPAAAQPIPSAANYAELLEPVPDAMSRLQIHDELVSAQPGLETVQYRRYEGDYDHHHHHHHHHAMRSGRWYRSHGYDWNGGAWIVRQPDYYDHHHHHHQQSYRGN